MRNIFHKTERAILATFAILIAPSLVSSAEIAATLPPLAGLVAMLDKDLRHIRGQAIGMIFQEPMTSLNPVFTIGNQIGEVLSIHTNLTKEEIRAE
ncbi:MAG: hypothetical protein ACE5E3_05100, partial [Mariprofundus sp.]